MAAPTAEHTSSYALPLLADLQTYRPNTFDYVNARDDGKPVLKDWLEVFRSSVSGFHKMAKADVNVPESGRAEKADAFSTRFHAILDQLLVDPLANIEGFGSAPVNCLRLCTLRDECLRQAGFQDAYKQVKAEENEKAVALLRGVLDTMDSIADARERMESALRGVFAGNIFDLGAAASTALFEKGGESGTMFTDAKANLVDRPWAVDCLDAVLKRMEGPAHNKALIFVDNAGSDVVLGILPFARELLKRGTEVVLAANEVPSINDVTVEELMGIVTAVCEVDPLFAAHSKDCTFRVVSSGNDLPVIDLSKVGRACVAEAQDVDLVVLEGMGRGIETNLYAELTCESLKLGMIKHPEVATCLGGRLYDCVCQYHAGTAA